MPGPTRYLGDDPNQFSWSVDRGRATTFEVFIFSYLRQRVATKDGRTKVIATPRTGDKGRDIEIHHRDVIELFGSRIAPPADGTTGIVFVECKSTQKQQLDDGFLVDASQHANDECSHYVLVTNAVITPYCHHRAEHEWRRRNSEFVLVDRRRLYDCLSDDGMLDEARSLGLLGDLTTDIPLFERGALVVCTQTEHNRGSGKHLVNIYVSIRNYSNQSLLASLRLASDLTWVSDRNQLECVVEASRDVTFLVQFTRLVYDSRADLGVLLTVDGRSQKLVISSAGYQFVFDTPFVGTEQRAIQTGLRKLVEEEVGFNLISVQGEAGVGKSRIIRSALEPLKGGRYDIFRFDCDPHSGNLDLSEFFEKVKSALPDIDTGQQNVFDAVRAAALLQTPVVFILEDLHHAEASLIDSIKRLVASPPLAQAPIVIIISGRDDYTFPNTDYYALLDLLGNSVRSVDRTISVPLLSEEDARTLVRSVAVDLPEIAVERIYQLGQNNPFIIIECLQYLLDVGLARLLSRQTIAILDAERFAGLTGLPASVEELYEQRITALRATAHGKIAFEFLCAASFFGPLIDKGVFEAFFDGSDYEPIRDVLITRRFFTLDFDESQLKFAHENVYHFLRRWARTSENSLYAAEIVLNHPGLPVRLNPLARGELLCMGGEFSMAFELLSPIWNRICAVTNFSSEEIDKSFYPYLSALFDSSIALKSDKNIVAKIALTKGYMGVHNFPLLQGEQACSHAELMLQRLYPRENQGVEHRLIIRQLRAHALQNMGRTTEAYKIMLELEAQIKEGAQTTDAFEFDLYDRMQEYYRKINHPELMWHYGRLAKRSVDRSTDEKLLASHLITQSLASLFTNEEEALAKARSASKASRTVGIRRFVMFNRLTELVVGALYAGRVSGKHREIHDEARDMLREAALESFSDSIVRLELLLATTALFALPDPREARRVSRIYIEAGQGSALHFGIGLFDWAFDNLSAVLDLADERPDELVRRRFRRCLERLKRRGLNHVGACGGTYPSVFAIANAVRFFGQFSEKAGLDVLTSTVFSYDSRILSEEDVALRMVKRAGAGHSILWPERRWTMVRYPLQNGYFTPLF